MNEIDKLLASIEGLGFEWSNDMRLRKQAIAITKNMGPHAEHIIPEMCWAPRPLVRHLGARLAQYSGRLSEPDEVWDPWSEAILVRLSVEEVDDVRAALAETLARSEDRVLTAALVGLLSDPSPLVRTQACYGLRSPFYDDLIPPFRLKLLMDRLNDVDEDVRSWAILGLAQAQNDDPHISDTLVRLAETGGLPAEDVGYICGRLAEHTDSRAIPLLESALAESDVSVWTVEAASMACSPKIHHLLNELRARDWADGPLKVSMLDKAIWTQSQA